MKLLMVLILCLTYLHSKAQKYALIDLNTKLPILYTDSVSAEQVSKGYFPVEKKCLDTFLANVNYIGSLIKTGTRVKMESFDLIAGTTKITVKRVPFAYGDRFEAVGETRAGNVKAVATMTNVKKSEKKMKKEIDDLINYITQDQSLYGKYKEVNPYLENITVVKD